MDREAWQSVGLQRVRHDSAIELKLGHITGFKQIHMIFLRINWRV